MFDEVFAPAEQISLANNTLYLIYNSNLYSCNESQVNDPCKPFDDGRYLVNLLNSPVIVTNNIIFASDYSKTYAFSLESHHIIWTYPESGKLSLGDDNLFITNDKKGTITAIKLTK